MLERSQELSVLGKALAAVREGLSGRLVLVGGEAGIGKSALIRRFCDEHQIAVRVLRGSCDPVIHPTAARAFPGRGRSDRR